MAPNKAIKRLRILYKPSRVSITASTGIASCAIKEQKLDGASQIQAVYRCKWMDTGTVDRPNQPIPSKVQLASRVRSKPNLHLPPPVLPLSPLQNPRSFSGELEARFPSFRLPSRTGLHCRNPSFCG
ncbi:hypothetical protein K1719_011818 [Acacia pycnantha]|nr:hypothetical protein K1719_011818 [Acacia pycnantha]